MIKDICIALFMLFVGMPVVMIAEHLNIKGIWFDGCKWVIFFIPVIYLSVSIIPKILKKYGL